MRILIDKAENKLYLYENGQVIREYPVATGRTSDITPVGTFSIVVKIVDPSWTNPETGETIPGGDPANPLGSRWLGLSVGNTGGSKYGIHGTNNPSSIGGYITHGCVRMYPEDVEELFDMVPLGTMVTIRD